MPKSWHTRRERDLIEDRGGEWHNSYGVDGEIGGKPVEVRVARKEDRFRLNKGVHRELVREGGSYVFDKLGDGKPPKKVPADEVSDIMGRGSWHSDRGYKHRFVGVDEIF